VHIAGIAYEYIQPAIMVDISHHHTGTELWFIAEARFERDIIKHPVAFVQEKFIAALVGGKKNICQSIVIDIADTYSASVVKIPVIQDIDDVVVFDGIAEFNADIMH
jgi:hypothetical protein